LHVEIVRNSSNLGLLLYMASAEAYYQIENTNTSEENE